MGSPKAVPVPCITTWCTSSASIPASLSAVPTSTDWDGPWGAVKLLDLPSWFTAEPISRASLPVPTSDGSPRFTISATIASARPYPSALASKVLHLPSVQRACNEHTPLVVWGISMMLVPATVAASHSEVKRPFRAICAATSEEEHAVSVLMHGPLNPNVYDTRPTKKLRPLPVPV